MALTSHSGRLHSQNNDLHCSRATCIRVVDPHTQGTESDAQSVDCVILLLLSTKTDTSQDNGSS